MQQLFPLALETYQKITGGRGGGWKTGEGMTFSLSREGHGVLGRIPGDGRDIFIPYLGRVNLFPRLTANPTPPPANF